MWKRETGIIDPDIDISALPVEFCRWFCLNVKQPRWSKMTFWLYRLSLMRYFEEHGPKEAVDMLSELHAPQADFLEKKTSAKKLKGISSQRLTQLLSRLDMYGLSGGEASTRQVGRLDRFIASWLRVTVKAGLRPTEWQNAVFEDKSNTLVVKNAKVNANRGNGLVRHLTFDPVTQVQEIVDIQNFLQDLSIQVQANPSFSILYDKCRKRIRYVAKQLWPRMKERPTIYSARHQFAANMKKTGLSKKEVAALMGHKSDASAGVHYARRSRGEVVLPPASPIEEVESVLERDSSFWVNVKKAEQPNDCEREKDSE